MRPMHIKPPFTAKGLLGDSGFHERPARMKPASDVLARSASVLQVMAKAFRAGSGKQQLEGTLASAWTQPRALEASIDGGAGFPVAALEQDVVGAARGMTAGDHALARAS